MHRVKPYPVEGTNRKNLLHKEPSAINEKMIREGLIKLLPRGDEGKYAKQAGINPRKATHLLIEYQSISQIANISHMILLTKLQLCNNVILKIENLDTLVNIKHLDLSFNSIRKIEGLDNLKQISFLNLHRNLITTLENMDNLLKLEIFLISVNGLDNLENIKYLRRFVRLSAVCLNGNPICDQFNFKSFVIAFLPDLFMLDYYHVAPSERYAAEQVYKTRLERLVLLEDSVRRRASVVEAEEAVREVYKRADVETFAEDEFWPSLFENDTEGKLILMLSDLDDVQLTYHELFRRAAADIFHKGTRALTLRENEYEAFNKAIGEAKDEVKAKVRGWIEEFTEWSRPAVRDMRAAAGDMEALELRYETTKVKKLPPEYPILGEKLNKDVVEFVRRLHKLWYNSMTAEIELNEQIVEVGSELDRSVRDLVSECLEQLRGLFAAIRDVQMQFNERVVETLITYGDFRADDTSIPEELRTLVTDKDALAMVIQASHEHHCGIIDAREETTVVNLKKWLESAMVGIRANEVARNRMRISEISHYVDSHRKNLDELGIMGHVKCYVPDLRSDQDYVPTEEEIKENRRARKKALKKYAK